MLGHPHTYRVNEARQSQATYIKTHFNLSLPPQCHPQAVVCVSTPKMYLRSVYFLVLSKTDDKNKAFMCIIRGRFKNYVGKQEGGVIKCLCYLILSKVVHQRGRGGQKHPKSCFSGFLKAPKSNICFDIVCFTIDPSSVFFYIGSIVCN